MPEITKKQKVLIESCREQIEFIIAQASEQAVANNWNNSDITISSIYNSFRILNIIQGKLNNN